MRRKKPVATTTAKRHSSKRVLPDMLCVSKTSSFLPEAMRTSTAGILGIALLAGCDASSRAAEPAASHVEEQRAAGHTAHQSAMPKTIAENFGPVIVSSPKRDRSDASFDWTLALPVDWTAPQSATLDWTEVHIQRFIVRLPSGRQESIVWEDQPRSKLVQYQLKESGVATVVACVDSFNISSRSVVTPSQYCLKRVIGTDTHGTLSSTNRFGEPVELRPLVAPEQTLVGSDLPIMAYADGERARDVQLLVQAPDGSVRTIMTGNAGTADLHIDQAGPWRIRMKVGTQSRYSIADLEFDNSTAKEQR